MTAQNNMSCARVVAAGAGTTRAVAPVSCLQPVRSRSSAQRRAFSAVPPARTVTAAAAVTPRAVAAPTGPRATAHSARAAAGGASSASSRLASTRRTAHSIAPPANGSASRVAPPAVGSALSTYAAQDSKRLQQTARMLGRDLRPSARYGQVLSASPRLAHTRRADHATSLLKHSPRACVARLAASALSTFALQV